MPEMGLTVWIDFEGGPKDGWHPSNEELDLVPWDGWPRFITIPGVHERFAADGSMPVVAEHVYELTWSPLDILPKYVYRGVRDARDI